MAITRGPSMFRTLQHQADGVEDRGAAAVNSYDSLTRSSDRLRFPRTRRADPVAGVGIVGVQTPVRRHAHAHDLQRIDVLTGMHFQRADGIPLARQNTVFYVRCRSIGEEWIEIRAPGKRKVLALLPGNPLGRCNFAQRQPSSS